MANPENPNYIIAIGASAGGIEEINTFFDSTPCDGVAYVIVQHLSPDFKSRMVELLAKHSKLALMEAEEGMVVQPGKVYLIPNDQYMTIEDGKLHLTPKDYIHGPHLTINTFFNSLATNSGKDAIAVVLSGLGSDGTAGANAIKRAGGMVIARNPETSEFSSMPANAIASGAVDFILEPALMPAAIEDYVQRDGKLLETPNDEKNLASIIDLIKENSSLDFSEYKSTTLLRRIKRRCGYNNFTSLERYLEFLQTSPEEVEALSRDFLISVTSFFRDSEAFACIKRDVLPGIIQNLAPGEELKMWVAGCATGEEAYSIAILVAEQLTSHQKDTVVKIFATDIDTVALIHAGKGIYPSTITRDVPPDLIAKYFSKEGKNYKVKQQIRNMVIFAQHDLVKNPPYCNMQLISCRNLLIYMTPSLQKKIFFMLLFGLKKDGYLFLGCSENPIPIIENLEIVNKKWKIYKNLQKRRTVHSYGFSVPDMMDIKQKQFSKKENPENQMVALPEALILNLVNEMHSLVVYIDENNVVIKSYGDTTKYLLQKNFNSNLPELLPRPLAVAFNILVSEAARTNQKVTGEGIKIKQQEKVTTVRISVIPLAIKKDQKNLIMVIFSEDQSVKPTNDKEVIYNEKIFLDQYTLNLEEEVKELKSRLQGTYEQLDRSNDNMQSFNEELLSANEEMQSTNEEMQSVNEELHTLNSEYLIKNNLLTEINDDLNNYFRSNTNGQLFVNNELLLMKFSPGTIKQINLRESDIGRPLSNISTNIKFETITEDIRRVIADGSTITKEIETENGKWYQIMTMPYILANHTRNGAMITFNDITELKETQIELDRRNKSLLLINADLDNFINAASHDLLGPLSNIELSISVLTDLKVSDDPQLLKVLAIINKSFTRFRTLVAELGKIGKIESGMSIMEAIKVNELIDDIQASIDNRIKVSGTIVTVDVGDIQIYFPKKNLRSIIYNLITNAIKFKSPSRPPEIKISAKSESGYSVLIVEDNGIGMDPSQFEKIFSLYGKLDSAMEGQGIGLYLVRKIINASGGKIVVESAPDKGSVFTVYFATDATVSKGAVS